MAIPSCDPWGSNTIRDSAQIVACRETTPRAGFYALEQATFNAMVLDALQRLAQAGVAGFTNLSNASECDLDENAHNAYVQVRDVSLPLQTDTDEQQAYILWALGNALCANNA